MRVLQVVLSLNAGGTERLVVELVRRLQRDVPMAVCCLDDDGIWGRQLRADGVPVHVLHRRPGFQIGLGRAIARVAAEHRADSLHCHHYSPFVYGALARIWHRSLRVVYTEHGRTSDAPPSSKRRLANRVFARGGDAVFTVSSELRDHLVAEGFAPEAVGVIYNGIDVGPIPGAPVRALMRARLKVADETLVVGTIARLDPVKDLGTLIEAVSEVSLHRPVLLIIVGDGSERTALEAVASQAGVAQQVRFLGHSDEARNWLAACDVYANSSISEGVSLTILEAMAARLPLVVTRVGGTPEVVPEACGRLVPARDPRALARALMDLANDPAGRDALAATGRRRVEEHFTLDRMIREYHDVYQRLA